MRKISMAASMAVSLVGALALSACEEEVPYSTYGQQDEEGVIEGLTVSDARMILAPVEGNPAAIYLNLAYSGDSAVAISGVEIDGASNAMIHDTMEWEGKMTMAEAGPFTLRDGDEKTLEPGGTHIMVMQPSRDLKPGGKVSGTLKIAGARTHKFEAEIRAAGEER